MFCTYAGSGSPVATHGISMVSYSLNTNVCGGSIVINGGIGAKIINKMKYFTIDILSIFD